MKLAELVQWYDFTGRTVLITGGAGVLGGEMACGLIGCGANVVILDRDPAPAARLADRAEVREKPRDRLLVVGGDVLQRETLLQARDTVVREFGGLHALINAAGGNRPTATTGDALGFFDLPEDALRHVFDLNLLGTVLSCQVFGSLLADRGEGAILNISSVAALRPLTRVPAYAAAKAGVSNFTRWLAVHMAQNYSPRIRVNALMPGFFLTEQNRYLLTEPGTGTLTARGRSIIEHTPMGRFGDPAELLGAMLWLLSPASSFVTGVVVPVDGGFTAFAGV